MATWTYSGYESEASDAARLVMARQFKKELLDAMKDPQSVGSDGHSMSRFQLDALMATVNEDILRYETKSSQIGGINRVRFVRPR